MTRDEILAQIRIATQVPSTELSDDNVVIIINQGLEEIAVADDWAWLEQSVDISLVADQQGYNLPADFNRHQALVDDDNDRTLPYLSPGVFFQQYGNDTGNTATQPLFWTIWAEQILITPTPEANDTNRLTLYYYEDPTTLSTTSSVPEFDGAFHWILVEYAKWKIWERQEYFDAADRAFQYYTQYLTGMINFYKDRVSWPPFIYGDGRYYRLGDPNIPSLKII